MRDNMPAKKEIIYIEDIPHKDCTLCGDLLPLTDYHPRGVYKDGSQAYKSACMLCNNENTLNRYYRKMKDSPMSRRKASYRYNLKSQYNLSEDKYNTMHLDQNGKCKICEIPISNVFKEISGELSAVDHNHSTNEVRGLLCKQCNSGIGFLKDSKEVLLKAIKYLEGTSGQVCV